MKKEHKRCRTWIVRPPSPFRKEYREISIKKEYNSESAMHKSLELLEEAKAELRYCIGLRPKPHPIETTSFDWDRDLEGQSLKGRFLLGFDFREVKLRKADLRDGNFRSSDFSEANARSANFANANLSNCLCLDTNFTNANLESVNFTYATLTGSDFTDANLRGANFTKADVTDVCFDNANLLDAIGLPIHHLPKEAL